MALLLHNISCVFRDQIWFSEKDEKGIYSLYSLAEYKLDDKKVRNYASYNKDYLVERYGAVPLLKASKGRWVKNIKTR